MFLHLFCAQGSAFPQYPLQVDPLSLQNKTPRYGQKAGSTHPAEMHTCLF